MANYTSLTEQDACLLLEGFAGEIVWIKPIETGYANSSYYVEMAPGKDVVLTVLDNHTPQTAEKLILLTDWLIEKGVPTPPIMRDSNKIALRYFGGRPSVVKPFSKGNQPSHLQLSQVKIVGEVMAEYHALEKPVGIELPSRRLPDDWQEVIAHGPHQLRSLVADAHESLMMLGGNDKCLIHGDLFPDNMIWSINNELTILDWETASIDYPELDIGFMLVGLMGGAPFEKEILEAFLLGYSPGGEILVEEIIIASKYACAVLAFHRYVRHVVRFPNPSKVEFWKELLPFAYSLNQASK